MIRDRLYSTQHIALLCESDALSYERIVRSGSGVNSCNAQSTVDLHKQSTNQVVVTYNENTSLDPKSVVF